MQTVERTAWGFEPMWGSFVGESSQTSHQPVLSPRSGLLTRLRAHPMRLWHPERNKRALEVSARPDGTLQWPEVGGVMEGKET